MSRPNSVSNEDLQRWGSIIDDDPNLDKHLVSSPIIREVLYAGQYLSDHLKRLQCPETLIGQILYTAGQLSFGQKDPWEVHLDLLEKYMDGSLIVEDDFDEAN
jgi:hypothetical protein